MRTGLDGAGDGTVSGPRALVVIDFLGGFNASMGSSDRTTVDSTDGGVDEVIDFVSSSSSFSFSAFEWMRWYHSKVGTRSHGDME